MASEEVLYQDWNGVSLLVALGEQEPTVTLTSGTWGYGAFWNSWWFQLAWSDTACTGEVNIAVKELIPIVMAAAMWGKAWEGQVVCCRCDNDAVVAVLNKRTSRDQDLMDLLRCLSFFEARFSFRAVASHIPGVQNSLADDLSRNKLSSFSPGYGPGHFVLPVQTTSATWGHADQPKTALDISSLEEAVQRYFENGLAPSNRRTYKAGINKFMKYCALYSISTPLPVSQSLLCSYNYITFSN